jgi:hypothetical protein
MGQKATWQDLYQAALLELDSDELRRRIEDAHNAVHQRIMELRQDSPGLSEETIALETALRGLRVLTEMECRPKLSGRGGWTQNGATS